MEEYEIDILGSCVTRDAFEYLDQRKKKYKINNCISRTSIISLTSPPINYEKSNISITSKWQKRMIEYECNKDALEQIKKSNSKYLIIDFIDERYDLVKIDNTYLNYSNELKKSNLLNYYKNVKIISRESKEYQDLFNKHIKIFINELNEISKDKKIIIHKALWKEEFLNNKINNKQPLKNIIFAFKYGGIKILFSKRKLKFLQMKEIQRNNNYLNYNYFMLNGKFDFISINDKYIADKGHKWGLSPFHYEKSYYYEFLNELDNICN